MAILWEGVERDPWQTGRLHKQFTHLELSWPLVGWDCGFMLRGNAGIL